MGRRGLFLGHVGTVGKTHAHLGLSKGRYQLVHTCLTLCKVLRGAIVDCTEVDEVVRGIGVAWTIITQMLEVFYHGLGGTTIHGVAAFAQQQHTVKQVKHVRAGLVDRADHGGVVGSAGQPVQGLDDGDGRKRVQA